MVQPPPATHPASTSEPRRRALDNPRVLIVAAVVLLALLAGLFWLSESTSRIALPVQTDVLLYPLVAVDIALILVLSFVLARNLLKLWVERQVAPFGRFRAKLVAALLAMTIVPAVLVLISGSEIISNTAARWFSEPVTEVLNAGNFIASRYYQERRDAMALRASRLARTLPPEALVAEDVAVLGPLLDAELSTIRDGMIEVYAVTPTPAGAPPVATFLLAKESESLPRDHVRASADRLASQSVASGRVETTEDPLDGGGLLVRAAEPITSPDGARLGAVVVSQHLGGDVRSQAHLANDAYQRYQALRVLKGPIQVVNNSIFLAVTLLILMGATWTGLYLAKRITRPVQMLADGARAIGAGQLDFRLEAETTDELGSLVEAFNMMAAELRTSRERLDQSRRALEATNAEVDARRRYIETILERAATGVISLDALGLISTVNGAAERLLGIDARVVGQPVVTVCARPDLQPLRPLVEASEAPASSGLVQEITLARDDREVHLAATATVLRGDGGRREGAVLVLDDVTPLIRAQRVAAWRDVARRLAHEIKNPLTPIQLSAERLRRHVNGSAAPDQAATRRLVVECTDAIITEVEALKGLVDEFAQFARLRGPRMAPGDLNHLVEDALRLYAGVLQQGGVTIEPRLEAGLPAVRFDAEQIRQVILNLVDNAMEALGGPQAGPRPDGRPPAIDVRTCHDAGTGVVRLTVTDNGPGVPPGDRDKLFMPYYSTKGRGSGLGLAIVRRIVAEHGGVIDAGNAQPSGTTFTVELPAA